MLREAIESNRQLNTRAQRLQEIEQGEAVCAPWPPLNDDGLSDQSRHSSDVSDSDSDSDSDKPKKAKPKSKKKATDPSKPKKLTLRAYVMKEHKEKINQLCVDNAVDGKNANFMKMVSAFIEGCSEDELNELQSKVDEHNNAL